MLFSVIIVCRNAKEDLLKTIDSLKSQVYLDFEIQVVDGSSVDGSIELLEELSKTWPNKILYTSEPDKGIYDAMNKGVLRAKGNWFFFLNAGDTFFDENVLKTVSHEIDKKKRILYGPVITDSGHVIPVPDILDLSFIKNSMICHQGLFYNKSCFMEVGTYSLKYSLAADYEHLLRCCILYRDESFSKKISTTISCYDTNGISSRKSKYRKLQYIGVRIRYGYLREAMGLLKHMIKNA